MKGCSRYRCINSPLPAWSHSPWSFLIDDKPREPSSKLWFPAELRAALELREALGPWHRASSSTHLRAGVHESAAPLRAEQRMKLSLQGLVCFVPTTYLVETMVKPQQAGCSWTLLSRQCKNCGFSLPSQPAEGVRVHSKSTLTKGRISFKSYFNKIKFAIVSGWRNVTRVWSICWLAVNVSMGGQN